MSSSDSSYKKSYSLTFKLTSPYGNIASIFWSIYVPLLHLIALSMPRQNSLQGYDSPYILKCFSKGWFACDMGIVESIDVKRPEAGHWTIEGLPTQLEITLSIKDLYPTVMMTHRGLGSIHKYNTEKLKKCQLFFLTFFNIFSFYLSFSIFTLLKTVSYLLYLITI